MCGSTLQEFVLSALYRSLAAPGQAEPTRNRRFLRQADHGGMIQGLRSQNVVVEGGAADSAVGRMLSDRTTVPCG